MIEARLSHHGSEEVEEVSEALIQLCQYMHVCNETGTFQPDSLSGDVTLTGNARCDGRRSRSVTPLPMNREQGMNKLESVTKVEIRNQRNNVVRALTNTSRLVVSTEIRPCKENISNVETGEDQLLEDAHFEPPVVPAVVLTAMQSLQFQQRLLKAAAR